MVSVMADRPTQNRLFDVPTGGEIAAVVREIILAVKTDRGVSTKDLARLFGVSKDTVERLEDMTTEKVPASVITAIGAKFGEAYIQPYFALFGCKAIKLHCQEAVNALPALTSLSAKIAAAMIGGKADLDHIALADMLGELRDVDAVVSKLRARASDLGMAA